MTTELIAATSFKNAGDFTAFAVIADPLTKFTVPTEQLMEMCGVLVNWACLAVRSENMKQSLEDSYGFGTLLEMTGGTVTDNGTYQYPEDPDLYPLVTVYVNMVPRVHIYEYAIVALVQGQDTFVTRMD